MPDSQLYFLKFCLIKYECLYFSFNRGSSTKVTRMYISIQQENILELSEIDSRQQTFSNLKIVQYQGNRCPFNRTDTLNNQLFVSKLTKISVRLTGYPFLVKLPFVGDVDQLTVLTADIPNSLFSPVTYILACLHLNTSFFLYQTIQ